MPVSYRNFDLQIRRARKGYSVLASSTDAGDSKCDFRLPFSEDKLESLLTKLGTPRSVRSLGGDELEAAKTLGGELFKAAFSGQVGNALAQSISSARKDEERLRIRLRLTGTAELANLPWEYLYDESNNRFLTLSHQTSIVRYLEIPQAIQTLKVQPPLRVLVMVASPLGLEPLDASRECEKLKAALSKLPASQIKIERLETATLSALQEKLSDSGPYHIFHYIGHGGFSPRTGKSVLVMERPDRQADFVEGQRLSVVLHNHPSLRLAILNACQGSAASPHDVFSGVAQSLIQQELPAVVAMQFEITDEAAITFAGGFYGSLARGNPVDTAVLEARLAIHAADNNVEWGTPTLYLRTPDGQIFDFPAAVVPAETQPPISPSPKLPNLNVPAAAPTGALGHNSPFYVERAADRVAIPMAAAPGVTLAIQSAGQTGASSLLRRVREAAKTAGKQVLHVDFQTAFDPSDLTNAEDFYRRFCVVLTHRLDKEDRVAERWERLKSLSIGDRCTGYLRYLLQAAGDQPLMLALDEVDRLIDTKFRSSFFGMLRSWHQERAEDELFERLDLVLVTSLEPHQLIDDPNQSPFNVGEIVRLNDFTLPEAVRLNAAYGSPLDEAQLAQLLERVGGHPRLLQLSLHKIVKEDVSLKELFAEAARGEGAINGYLVSWLDFLSQNQDLREGLKAILSRREYDFNAFLKLRKLGLIRREGTNLQPRCKLYEDYFRMHLNV